jgi:hypothetical protein
LSKESWEPETEYIIQKFECQECNYTEEVPTHCGKPMRLKDDSLICWMGPDCESSDIPEHHGKPMKIIQ